MTLSHIDSAGRARMVDVGEKPVTERRAIAEGRVLMSTDAFERVRRSATPKGDVLAVAELAGVMGAKRTSELIPLCHPIALDRVSVELELVDEWPGVRVTATASATARTGVEMEALTAVSVACLTVYDMVMAGDREMRMTAVSDSLAWKRPAGCAVTGALPRCRATMLRTTRRRHRETIADSTSGGECRGDCTGRLWRHLDDARHAPSQCRRVR